MVIFTYLLIFPVRMSHWVSWGWRFTFQHKAPAPVVITKDDVEREDNGRVSQKKGIKVHIDQSQHPARVDSVMCNLALPITVCKVWVYVDYVNIGGIQCERLLCIFQKSIHHLDPNYF